jgi:hypothetical protein
MRKLTALLLGCLLSANFAFAGEPNAADQKWLQAIENMVTKGEKKVTTSKEERVSLVKDWAGKNGYSVKVTKAGNCFSLEFAAKEPSKNVAQK